MADSYSQQLIDEWKEYNPYDPNQYYTGPNDIITVPSGEQNNLLSYNHDASYVPYENPHLGSVPSDLDWIRGADPMDPTTIVGIGVFAAKGLLPRARLKKQTGTGGPVVKEPPYKRHLRKVGKGGMELEDEFNDGDWSKWSQSAKKKFRMSAIPSFINNPRGRVKGYNARHPLKRSFRKLHGKRMAGFKRKGRRSFRKAGKRRRFLKKGRRVRRRRFGKSLRRLGRRIKRVARKLQRAPTLEVRRYTCSLAGGSGGVPGKWMYRNVDNMFTSYVDSDPDVPVNVGMGWNYSLPFRSCVKALYGAYPTTNSLFHFTRRKMCTLIQAPSTTPTFVEVYLLKPLHLYIHLCLCQCVPYQLRCNQVFGYDSSHCELK